MKEGGLEAMSDREVVERLHALLDEERRLTSVVLAHLGEVDARRLYLPAACSSMHVYCVRVLGMSEDQAFKRIRAARAVRRFPVVGAAVAQGRLHLSGVVLLAPHLTEENVRELVTEASGRSKAEIEILLARRAPRGDVPVRLDRVAEQTELVVPAPAAQVVPGPAAQVVPAPLAQVVPAPLAQVVPAPLAQVVPGPAAQVVPGPAAQVVPAPLAQVVPGPAAQVVPGPAAHVVPAPPDRHKAKVVPLSPERFALQMTIGAETRDKLLRAQALLRHRVPSGDLAEVLDRALDALLEKVEATKFGKVTKPRAAAKGAGAGGTCRVRRGGRRWRATGRGARSSPRMEGGARRPGSSSSITWCRWRRAVMGATG